MAQARHALERSRRARHAVKQPGYSIARALSITACALLAFGVGGIATAYVKLQSNIQGGDFEALIAERPERTKPDPEDQDKGEPLNLLLIGSDDRSGENAGIGGNFEGMRSDTTILMHISAERDRVELVSLPRDLMVDIPACRMTNGKETVATYDQFNSAFAFGAVVGGDVESAAACAIATTERLTNVYIDGYFVVDFKGFITMVDAIGGVDVCIPNDIYAPKANNLRLEAGMQHLDGEVALDYARARVGKGLGDGSDLGRIQRQQQLLATTVNKVLSKNLLTQQVELYRFLDAATKSLAADEKFASIPTLAGLAYSLRNIDSGNITFMTPKVVAYPQDPNRVIFTEEAQEVWRKIAADEPLKTPKKKPAATDSPSSDPTSTADETPDASDEPTTPPDDDDADVLTPDDVVDLCS